MADGDVVRRITISATGENIDSTKTLTALANATATNAADAVAKALHVTALASSQAAALRMNNTLSTINTTIRSGASSFANTFVTSLEKGESVMQALKDSAADLGKSLQTAGINSLVTSGLNSLGGASQTAGATASAAILTTAGTTLAAAMVAGATSASEILGTGGTSAAAGLTTGGTAAATGLTTGGTVAGAGLTTGGASASGFIVAAAGILDVSTASLAAIMGPLAAIAAIAVGVGISFGAKQRVSHDVRSTTTEGRQDNERIDYSQAA